MNRLNYISHSDKGTERKKNKDRIYISQEDGEILAILFDGISSAEEANEGIDIIIEFIKTNQKKLGPESSYTLTDLMFDANKRLIDSSLTSPFTTYSAMYVPSGSKSAIFSNLGDSRIYEVTPQYLKQVSQDDNLVNNKNVVTKYLGMVELERSDFSDFSLDIENKRFLLCSDGFYSLLEKNLLEFHKVLHFKRTANIKKSLDKLISGKNSDDSSYILIL